MIVQVAATNQMPCSLGYTCLIGHQLGQRLIHGNSGCGNMGTHIGDASQLQQALHGAVLAVFAVENREHHIDPFTHHTVALEAQQALTANGRDGCTAVIRMGLPCTLGQHGIVLAAKEDPIAFLGDTNGENVVLLLVDIVQYGFRGAQRNLMLGTHTAKKNTNA